MATLRGAIALTDNFSATINRLSVGLKKNVEGFKDISDAADKAEKNIGNFANSAIGQLKYLTSIMLTIATIGMLFGLSDQLSQINARLNMMNDGMQSTQQLQRQIYESAERTRASYLDTVDAISKMGILAKDAFGSNRELIAFMEQVNKQFAIAGTSLEGQKAAMLQLTQAMGSGVLRGEELNSIYEQAPTIIQAIAKHLGVTTGQIRNMAASGLITAEVVKEALLSTAAETNAAFESMPKTWGQVWTSFQNKAIFALEKVTTKLSVLANDPVLEQFASSAERIIVVVGGALASVFNEIMYLAKLGYENWDLIRSVLIGIGVALMVTVVPAVIAIGLAFLYANAPIILLIASVAVLVYTFVLLIDWINEWTGSSLSALGVVTGAFGAFYAYNHNLVVGIANMFLSLAEFLLNVFTNPLAATQKLFVNIWNNIIDFVAKALQSIVDMVKKVPFLSGLVDGFSIDSLKSEAPPMPDDYISLDAYKGNMIDVGESAKYWHDKGASFGNPDFDWDGVTPNIDSFGGAGLGGKDDKTLDETAKNTGKTAKNTQGLKDSLDENLKYFRDANEKIAISTYKPIKIDINMTNNNNVNNELDLDGVAGHLAKRVKEEMAVTAEGV